MKIAGKKQKNKPISPKFQAGDIGMKVFFAIGAIGLSIPTYYGFSSAFNQPYIDLLGILVGLFFGVFTALCILGIFIYPDDSFFDWPIFRPLKWFSNKGDTLLYGSLGLCSLSACLYLSFNTTTVSYTNTSIISGELEKIANYNGGGKSSAHIDFNLKQYPDFFFTIESTPYHDMDVNAVLNEVKTGDTLFLRISDTDLKGKIEHDETHLRFWDKIINYHVITIYGLSKSDRNYLSMELTNSSNKENVPWAALFYGILGILCIVIAISPLIKNKRKVNSKRKLKI